MSTVIKIENLSKRYYLSHKEQERFPTFRDAVTRGVSNFGRRLLHPLRASSGLPLADEENTEEFWALKDVCFEVKQGDRVGIIGRNGAGKSTLLKILSRITEPTMGRVSIKGRTASLLEVGTGFHPELTGRENIFLNGAILGMSRSDIRRKFDEIIAFSEVEKFLDTPVKRYSSGMYVRLAFAVAAHLEPEILIVDEVLAVGDAAFQKKCLGKMDEVSNDGKTILFVSHNMRAVSRLCNRCMFLQNGSVRLNGLPPETISDYLNAALIDSGRKYQRENDLNLPMCLIESEVVSVSKEAPELISRENDIRIKTKFCVNKKVESSHLYASILTPDDVVVFGTGDSDMDPEVLGKRDTGVYECYFDIPRKILNEGDYYVNISLGVPYQQNYQENIGALKFTVVQVNHCKGHIHNKRSGTTYLEIPWHYV